MRLPMKSTADDHQYVWTGRYQPNGGQLREYVNTLDLQWGLNNDVSRSREK